MDNYQAQKSFFERHWPYLREAAEKGSDFVVSYVESFTDIRERRVMLMFARSGLVFQDWQRTNFKPIIAIAKLGIDAYRASAFLATEEESYRADLDRANIISYNLAADLADCWPDDHIPRHRSEFEAGLVASENCIQWRKELNKDSRSLSIAYWASGYHRLRLDSHSSALKYFKLSLQYLLDTKNREEWPILNTSLTTDILLAMGYVALANWCEKSTQGKQDLENVLQLLAEKKETEEQKKEARFCQQQLIIAASRMNLALT